MTKKFCRQCGNALTKVGARFCTTCGATVDGAENDGVASQETSLLPGERTGQAVSADADTTEVLITPKPASNYNTEEMPTGITGRAEERATAVVTNAPVTQSQTKHAEPALTTQSSGRRMKLALVAALGVVALAAASFFIINSRRSPEAQAVVQPADKAETAMSAQPVAQQADQQSGQQSGAGANNSKAQPQTKPQSNPASIGIKSPAVHNAEANQQRQAIAKPTPATPQEKQTAGGTSAESNLKQGMTYLNADRFQEALREFEYVKKVDPGNKDVYYLIGRAYQGMNQPGQALEAYRQCASGVYAPVAQDAVKKLEKKIGKINAK